MIFSETNVHSLKDQIIQCLVAPSIMQYIRSRTNAMPIRHICKIKKENCQKVPKSAKKKLSFNQENSDKSYNYVSLHVYTYVYIAV